MEDSVLSYSIMGHDVYITLNKNGIWKHMLPLQRPSAVIVTVSVSPSGRRWLGHWQGHEDWEHLHLPQNPGSVWRVVKSSLCLQILKKAHFHLCLWMMASVLWEPSRFRKHLERQLASFTSRTVLLLFCLSYPYEVLDPFRNTLFPKNKHAYFSFWSLGEKNKQKCHLSSISVTIMFLLGVSWAVPLRAEKSPMQDVPGIILLWWIAQKQVEY